MSRLPHSPRARLTLLVAAVLLLHVWASVSLSDRMQDLRGAGQGPALERMQATYVSEVQLSRPPVAVAPPPAAAPAARAAAKAAAAASAASSPEPDPKAPARDAESADTAMAMASVPAGGVSGGVGNGGESASTALAPSPAPSSPTPSPPSPPIAAASAPKASTEASPRFVWPRATRVSYSVDGYFRGPVTGDASVEWVREGNRYQVHMEADAGLVGARFSSEGDIQAQGLYPRTFERVVRRPFSKEERTVIRMDADEVTMPDGKKIPRPDDAQDAVSFLIQLSYSFMLDPSKLVPGRSFKMQLMMPKRVEEMAFDVVGEEPLDTPLGRIQTLRVKPRSTRIDAGDLPADVWFAPELLYLPVRITMSFKNGSSLDLQMKRAPQTAPGDGPR